MPLPDVPPEKVHEALRQFDAEYRNAPEFANWESNLAHKWAIVVDGKRYPVKKIISLATGVPTGLLRDPERGREELRQVLEERIRLIPDESGKFLWADYALGIKALLPSAEIMVAGAGFSSIRRSRALRRAA